MVSSSRRSTGAMLSALRVLLLLLVLQMASISAAAVASKATASENVPLRVVALGLFKALPSTKSMTALAQRPAAIKNDDDNDDNDNDATAELPLVSARSIVLGNNITISKSRIVLSRLDQLFLLRKLLDTIDLAPKLASSTGKLSIVGGGAGTGGGATGNTELLEEGAPAASFAEGFLFELEGAKLKAADVDDDLMAVVDVAGSTLGFGWRYPLSYWNQLRDDTKPKCAFGKSFGRFYYC